MTAVLRAIGIALVMLTVYEGAALIDFVALCPQRAAWQRVAERRSPVVLSSGFGVARPGDAIFACTTRHCFGPIACHEDLECVCAPAALDPLQLAGIVGGSCVADREHPLPTDAVGACRYARCDDHVGP